MLSHIQLFAALWTVARQAPLTEGFPRQEYWSGCHFLLQRVFLTQGSNAPLLLSRRFFNTEPPGKPSKKRGGNIFHLESPTVKRGTVFYQLSWVLIRLCTTCFGNTPLIYLPCDSEGCHFWEHSAAAPGCIQEASMKYEDALWGSSQIMIGLSQCWSLGSGKRAYPSRMNMQPLQNHISKIFLNHE